MNAKRTSSAFLTSMILHGVIFFIAGIYLVTQTQQFKDLVGAEVLQAKEPPKPKVRKPVIKPVVKPTVPTTNTVIVEQVQVQPRVTTAAVVRTTSVQPQTVLEFSNKAVKLNAPINPNLPKVVTSNTLAPQVVTHAELPVSDAPGALAFSAPVATAPSAMPATLGRGVAGGIVQVKVAFERPVGLAMVKEVGVIRDALGDVVENITLGNIEVRPLPRGEPGGRIVGRGRDFHAVFRFTRVRHNLSDWWADASALNAFTKWLNQRTPIKADMNVEGGALTFSDMNIMKSPLLFMTGHSPSHARGLLRRGIAGDRLVNRLTEREATTLRQYLVEKGGFLVFDDCGVDAQAQGMARRFLAQMRYVMPEYHVERIPNDHELYNNFYQMGGPPVGFDIFWWGSAQHVRNFLEGFSVGERLAAMLVRRDYMCSMEAVSLPTRGTHYSPSVYRFMTNVALYSLTHGSISDYGDYVPEDKLAEQKLPRRAPEVTRIGALK